ncbi:hypothetical protein BV352_05696 [Pseudomonas syringae pv. actinidiae]|nr:hypothetical protein BV352_05696 [Pseudomonas syringae pv. actinidiae]
MRGISFFGVLRFKQQREQLLEQYRVIWKIFGHGNHALDYTR